MPRMERIVSDIVRQRLFLMKEARILGVKQACMKLGKHRSYYYYWFKRYQKGGWRALLDSSRRPKNMPTMSSSRIVKAVLRMRKKTHYGKERLHDELQDRGLSIPISTIGKILDRAGLLVKNLVSLVSDGGPKSGSILSSPFEFQTPILFL